MKRLLLAGAALVTFACAHGGEVDVQTLASSSDQILWEAGEKAAAKKNWESARTIYKRIIDGFPQSEYGPGARLALGDSYFQEGGTAHYILAIGAYRDFLTLYPSHPKSDYAQFQVAECHYKQKNPSDRDQSATEKALAEYERLLDLYPQSSYIESARTRIVDCRQTLARSEFMVAYFYQRTRRAYRAAISRYEALLSEYPDYKGLDAVLLRLSQALAASGRTPEALPHLARLLEEYPSSRYVKEARPLYDKLSATPAPPAAAPLPKPTPSPTPSPESGK
jgi:outer membrane protein assembly factor BamD